VLYQGDTRDLPEYRSQPDLPTYVQQTTKVPETGEKSSMKAFWDVFISMTNFNLLNDKKMVIICLVDNQKKIFFSTCSFLLLYRLTFVQWLGIIHLIYSLLKWQHPKEVFLNLALCIYYQLLVNIIITYKRILCFFLKIKTGFSNTAVRFASGWITKIPYMTPLLVNNIGLTIAGIATLLVPICETHLSLIFYCIIWGAFIGKIFFFENISTINKLLFLAFHVSLSPVIVCELVGLDRYSSALGLTLMFRGITSLSAPPVSCSIFFISFGEIHFRLWVIFVMLHQVLIYHLLLVVLVF
jgi:hypothetical protein